MYSTPVLFLVFNRPDTTRQVFEAIRRAKPKQLFIAADGPRPDRPGDSVKCRLVRQIAEQVDWDCDVKTLFREKNLGCKYAVSSAIDWFFERVEEGIILEDDTLPEASFFTYCAHLLAHYRHADKVMHISGVDFQFGRRRGNASYFFSRYAHVWGWASWRRAWHNYDVHMEGLGDFIKERKLENLIEPEEERSFWLEAFRQMAGNQVDTWDTQWLFSVWNSGGVCITPNVNLISNIGFGEGATHTTQQQSKLAQMLTRPIEFPLRHPVRIAPDRKADHYVFTQAIHIKPPVFDAFISRLKVLLPQGIKQKIKNRLS